MVDALAFTQYRLSLPSPVSGGIGNTKPLFTRVFSTDRVRSADLLSRIIHESETRSWDSLVTSYNRTCNRM